MIPIEVKAESNVRANSLTKLLDKTQAYMPNDTPCYLTGCKGTSPTSHFMPCDCRQKPALHSAASHANLYCRAAQ